MALLRLAHSLRLHAYILRQCLQTARRNIHALKALRLGIPHALLRQIRHETAQRTSIRVTDIATR